MYIKKISECNEIRPGERILVPRGDTETVALGHVTVKKGSSTKTGFHDDEEEVYLILRGKAAVMLGEEQQEAGPGTVVYVPRNTSHKMTCISDEDLEYVYFANWPGQGKS